jgi:rod shape-determining protein MreB
MLSKKIGIDLGTTRVVVYVKGEGVVVNEPALLATDAKGTRVLAVGAAASELLERGTTARALPLARDGDGLDYGVAGTMLHHLIGRVCGRQRIFRPDVMLSIPTEVTGLERRAVLEATMQAGAKTAYLIEKPLAAAIGANIPVSSVRAVVVCNLGAASSDAAIIALGDVVSMDRVGPGGTALDKAIADAVLARRGLVIAPAEAERLKIRLASATSPAEALQAAVSDDRPSEVSISAAEVSAAVAPALDEIAGGLARLIQQASPEQRAQIMAFGLVLTGGGAQLRGLSGFLSQRLGLAVKVARDPQACVAVGTGMALENLQVIRRGQHYMT